MLEPAVPQALKLANPAVLQLARFVAIGGLNTALDFLLLNLMSAATGIETGGGLGIINLVSFSVAILHSFLWNRAWTFGIEAGVAKTLFRAFVLCVLAVLGLGFAVAGAKLGWPVSLFAAAFVVFALAEFAFWKAFGIKLGQKGEHQTEFAKFLGVSLVGLIINSGGLAVLAIGLAPYSAILGGSGMVRNIAKALATGVSLVWNFLGYKLLVFRK